MREIATLSDRLGIRQAGNVIVRQKSNSSGRKSVWLTACMSGELVISLSVSLTDIQTTSTPVKPVRYSADQGSLPRNWVLKVMKV